MEHLKDLRAGECASVVRRAFKRKLVDSMVGGGFAEYLVAVGLPVDFQDKVLRHEAPTSKLSNRQLFSKTWQGRVLL